MNAADHAIVSEVLAKRPDLARPAATESPDRSAASPSGSPARRAVLTRASSIKSKRQRQLKRGAVPLSTLTVVAGRGGEGKSSLVLRWIADGTRGELDGDLFGDRIPAIIVAIEDDWPSVVVPRLKAAGADLDLVFRVDVATEEDGRTRESTPTLPLDVEVFRSASRETGARVLVLDPASSVFSGDLNKREDARQSLDALASLAQDEEIAVVLILHMSKGGGQPGDRLSGSHALRDAARSVLLVASDDGEGDRVVSVDKSNYGASVGSSFAFRLDPVTVTADDGRTMEVPAAVELGATDRSVGELMNRPWGDDDSDDRSAAAGFVIDYLTDLPGCEANAADVLRAGRAAGFSETELKNARRRSKSPRVESRKSGLRAGWVWGLAFEDSTEGVTSSPGIIEGVTLPAPDAFVTPSDTFAPEADPALFEEMPG
ncbi:AAA family ATPase [Plantibacter sp. CFBP 8804]|nr:AAA family ATPase [Plantibacter sp. CFBP 8804]